MKKSYTAECLVKGSSFCSVFYLGDVDGELAGPTVAHLRKFYFSHLLDELNFHSSGRSR